MSFFTRVANTHWPVTLREDEIHGPPYGSLIMRPLKTSDRTQWYAARTMNQDWLAPWEASTPQVPGQKPAKALTFAQYVRSQDRAARTGDSLSFVLIVDGILAGQLSVASITYGSLRGASIGYWVSRDVAGRGVAPTAVALAVDYCFEQLHLHRIEINIRPENHASLRVVEKLGLRDEGLRKNYLHIQGQWADHRTFAVTSTEVPRGLLRRWRDQTEQ
ncbi:GNAT family protein [Jonesiaceae bacterium BS-20]|uniref:GNAT family protein n=1 Tax=Jonesiaceae bacterium BS-20 TaxID=3120821 RepID=A0AAU7DXU3_9MICO